MTLLHLLILSLCTIFISGQAITEALNEGTVDANMPSIPAAQRSAVKIVSLDADSRLVEAVAEDQSTHSPYIEVATGLQYQDQNGQWRPSQEIITLMDDGSAVAVEGRYRVRFEPN